MVKFSALDLALWLKFGCYGKYTIQRSGFGARSQRDSYRDKILSIYRTAPQSWSEYTTHEQSWKS